MQALVQAALKVGAEIVLGDRPIEITLDRAWRAVTWPQRWAALAAFLQLVQSRSKPWAEVWGAGDKSTDGRRSNLHQKGQRKLMEKVQSELQTATQEVETSGEAGGGFQAFIEKVTGGEELEAGMMEAAAEYPAIARPLLHERDLYLAWSCKRSKAVNGKRRVVAVVGRGHMRGMMYAMRNDPHGEVRFSDLVGDRKSRASSVKQQECVLNLVRDTVVFSLLAWWVDAHGLTNLWHHVTGVWYRH
jgi:pheromone shutdown protein TraB